MLSDITIDHRGISRFKESTKNDLIDTKHIVDVNIIERGIFSPISGLGFIKEIKNISFKNKYKAIKDKHQKGWADSIEQIKLYFKREIENEDSLWVIGVDKVWQDKNCKQNGIEWYTDYIGDLEPKRKHFNDEDFGSDFKGYLLRFHIFKVK